MYLRLHITYLRRQNYYNFCIYASTRGFFSLFFFALNFSWDAFCGRWNLPTHQNSVPLHQNKMPMNPQPLLIVALFDEVPVRLVLLAPFKGGNVRTKERKREPVNRLFNSRYTCRDPSNPDPFTRHLRYHIVTTT